MDRTITSCMFIKPLYLYPDGVKFWCIKIGNKYIDYRVLGKPDIDRGVYKWWTYRNSNRQRSRVWM